MRARSAYVRSDLGENLRFATFPVPFLDREVFPFPSALQGPIQLQLALSVRAFDFPGKGSSPGFSLCCRASALDRTLIERSRRIFCMHFYRVS